MKYLKSPINPITKEEVGLTMFSAHTNGGAFPDPLGPLKLFRYLKGDLVPSLGDPSCSVTNPIQRHICYVPPTRSDVRLFAASGPFSLNPGESVTIVAAMFAAATVNTPLITRGVDNPPGIPSTHPGCAGDPVRPIEIAAGWISATCPADPNAQIDQSTIVSVPGSLIGKGLASQSVFDAKFLLPSSPAAPTFSLVPGDNQVAVFWQPSATETTGDPFFAAAADPDPTNALRDPNFRRFDVEGYRIFKGTKPSDIRLIAQFDKAGTSLLDYSCITDPNFVAGDACAGQRSINLNGPIVQYPVGGVVRLNNGSLLIVHADTASQGAIGSGGAQPLSDTGVPFTLIDRDVKNGFRYFYKVTSFDVNSLKSGPSSLESSSEIKNATPQKNAATLASPALKVSITGSDNVPLNPDAPQPTIDAEKGTFSGKSPPTNTVQALFAPIVERVVPKFRMVATIDSVVPLSAGMSPDPCFAGHNVGQACWRAYMTFDVDGTITKSEATGWTPVYNTLDLVTQTSLARLCTGARGQPGDGAIRLREGRAQPERFGQGGSARAGLQFVQRRHLQPARGHVHRHGQRNLPGPRARRLALVQRSH